MGDDIIGVPPAARENYPPVWDRIGVRWDYVPDSGQYICSDPDYPGPGVTAPGAIPPERQPFYGHEPTDVERAAAEIYSDER